MRTYTLKDLLDMKSEYLKTLDGEGFLSHQDMASAEIVAFLAWLNTHPNRSIPA